MDDDKTVKQMIDAATRAELERWFGLPSFERLADDGVVVEDPEDALARERRARATAAVDPALLDAMHQRNEVRPSTLVKFTPLIDVTIKTEMGSFDHAMAERQLSVGEPREIEVPEELRDDMKDVAPQALLRDLHRPESSFDKQFELYDAAAEQRLDIVAEVAQAMATSWKLPPLDPTTPFEEQRRLLAADRAVRRRPWTEIPMRNRRVVE